ncbi:MAG: hypothetical protein ACRECZ_02150 [Methylocella sp.]
MLYVVVGLCVAVAPFIYKYYLGVLAQGAKQEGSLERQDYDRLRASLEGSNLAARLYTKWLSAFLDGVDRFFGDAGMADRTLFPRAFGLKKPAPLWTAPALDRCLLLALTYPVATIFVIWAISGHVGPAEDALGLKPDLPGWSRSSGAAAIGFLSFATWRAILTTGWKRLVWGISSFAALGAGAIAIASAFAVAFAFAGVCASAAVGAGIGLFPVVAITYWVANILVLAIGTAVNIVPDFGVITAVAFLVAFAGLGTVASSVVIVVARPFAGPFARAFAHASAGPGAVAVASAVALAGPGAVSVYGSVIAMWLSAWMCAKALRGGRQGLFLALFLPAMIVICLVAAELLAPQKEIWEFSGPFLLFLGLLTLLNAPFDWVSLGLTRALLRRGLELGGWWPYLLALVDGCLAGVIIALLALTMVIGVQAFDELAVRGGGKPVLSLDILFDGIAKNPAAPEYWWAYALLLSTMIPSLINLAIGGMALTRGIPGLGRLLLNWIPKGRDVPDYRRPLAAIGLTVQMFAGAGLGIAAQALLAWGLLYHLMPAIGLDLLDMARAVAAFDLPARISQLFVSGR